MEGMYFSAFVLGMCTLDLMFRASGQLEAWWRRQSARSGRTGAEKSGAKPQPSDWYVFFHCADLLGKEPQGRPAGGDTARDRTPQRKDRRQPRATVR